MGEALYRKYRSKTLDEVVGQEHVTTTLKNALKSGKISHAYLLTGPRGVGKTSIARILAFEVNNLPYSDQSHLDIIEIDAASNRRIDEIRDIREKVRLAPTSAKYKVYIIDEVHMLTKEAFNALLKTLEEPPEHVIFILATTEVHKLPETIISRTQRFNLKPIDNQVIEKHLKSLAKKEKITISDDALSLIAEHSQGGLRDAISLFDQLSSNDNISVKDVEHVLGVAPEAAIAELIEVLHHGKPKDLLYQLNIMEQQGIQPTQIAHQLSLCIKSNIIEDNNFPDGLGLMEKLLHVPSAASPDKSLELILFDYLLSHSDKQEIIHNELDPPVVKPAPKSVDVTTPVKTSVSKPPSKLSSSDLEKLIEPENWQKILQAIKKRHNTVYGIVRMANPTIEDGALTLCFGFPFHQKRMSESKNRELLQSVIADEIGIEATIVCITKDTNDSSEPVKAKHTEVKSDTLETITDIFGGGEILES